MSVLVHTTQPNMNLHLPIRFRKVQDPVSCYTHFIGAIASLGVTIAWLIIGLQTKMPVSKLLSVLVFGLALISLYSASSYYHSINVNNAKHIIFRKLDHSMIYVLIVGSYTPIVVAYGNNGWLIAGILWAIAISGVIIKICWLNAPRWLYTGIYIALGWSIVFMHSVLINAPINFLLLILAGGIAYTVGGIIYIIKRPNINADWTFHEIFHILIMVGSFFHILAVWLYIVG